MIGSNIEAISAVVGALSFWAPLTVLKMTERQQTMNNFQMLMECNQFEFVAGSEVLYMIHNMFGAVL